jgi:Rrf2 family protein
MQLNINTEYTIRALLYLAMNRSTDENRIAETMEIPSPEVPAILDKLKKAGLVSAEHADGNGYALDADPEEVTLWDILALEGERLEFAPPQTENTAQDSGGQGGRRATEVCSNLEACVKELLRDVTLKDLMDRL